MTQAPLPLSAPKVTLCDRVAAVLVARAGQWVDGRELASVGGYAGYRTRISNLRTERGMVIDNRWRTVNGYRVSEYKYLPDVPEGRAGGSGAA